eukprot:TRINITY_DN9741_c0_g1_i1.p1 TRINITY_DN9741_c0_g1~~TRINITY_DN9741_c0_g1_i1.p1  ORF type:complete len:434 (+),score=100.07 TRINITY_DN9741_c0_g1_i1:95-1396(+)
MGNLFKNKRNWDWVLQLLHLAIQYYSFSGDHFEKRKVANVEELDQLYHAHIKNDDEHALRRVHWIDVDGLDPAVIDKLTQLFSLHSLAVEDVLEMQDRPKSEWYGRTLFFRTLMLSGREQKKKYKLSTNIDSERICLFVVGNTVLSIQEGTPGDVLHELRRHLEDPDSEMRLHSDPFFLFYGLLNAILLTCRPLIDTYDSYLQDLEMEMLANPSQALNRKVYHIKKNQLKLRSMLLPTKRAITHLMSRAQTASKVALPSSTSVMLSSGPSDPHMHPPHHHEQHSALISGTSATYFSDLQNTLSELSDKIETQRETATSIGTLYAEFVSHRQGQVSYLLAIVSAFFLPLTFVAGVYGMNFTIMPELQWDLGYLYVWMIFIGIVVFELLLFRWMGWISFGVKWRKCFSRKKNANKYKNDRPGTSSSSKLTSVSIE